MDGIPRDSLPLDRDRLESLPQRFDSWQLDTRPIVAAQPIAQVGQLWLRAVVSRTDDLVLALDVGAGEPTLVQLWQTLLKAIQEPETGEPHRPTLVQIKDEKCAQAFGELLRSINIESEQVEILDQIDGMLGELCGRHLAEGNAASLDTPDVSAEAMSSFFDGAALFFEHAPWTKTGERPIQVECSAFENGPWYTVIMGQTGITKGIILYDNLDMVRGVQQGDQSAEESANRAAGLVVTFEEKEELLPADLVAAQQHGWRVAAPNAYPSVYRMEPGLKMRPPLMWELQLLEGCLRALPEFVRKKTRRLEPMPITVPTAVADLALVLSWAAG